MSEADDPSAIRPGTPVEVFDYPLSAATIAQTPVEPRDAARLLVDRGPRSTPEHRGVRDLPALLDPGDVLVVNESRVLPARIRATKGTGGAVEVLLLERERRGTWRALVRPGRRVPPGTVVTVGDLRVEVGDDLDDGVRRVRLLSSAGVPLGGDQAEDVDADLDSATPSAGELAALAVHGEVPLPPYIHEALADPERYQTIFARAPGSVAAPTAGLHLTERVLNGCRARGVRVETVDLHVGLGTFRPIAAERVEAHALHAEAYRVAPEVLDACRAARAHDRRVIAVGTTTLRALEAAAGTGCLAGRTALYVHGDHPFHLVDRLLTNFHVPRSSLLVLVDAFVGPRWQRLYAEALSTDYRFLSFGDCCLLDRRWGRSPR